MNHGFGMNKVFPALVSQTVRMSVAPFGLLLGFFSTGCSGSRMIQAEQEIPAGNHVAKTVMESDLYVPEGASLAVDYSRGSRFFVSRGGALTGFPKGSLNNTVYAEEGAIVPNARSQPGVVVQTVVDAASSYRDRHRALPAGAIPGQGAPGNTVVPVVTVGAGFWGAPWGYWGSGFWGGGYRGGRPVSVRPSSYRLGR